MASFPIHPLSQFESGQTSIRRPRHFLQLSFDEKHELQIDSEESLRYYYPAFTEAPGIPVPSIDLSKGFDTWIKGDESVDSHLDGLLETIKAHEESLLESGMNVAEVKSKADIITWRGMMTKVCLPRRFRLNWKLMFHILQIMTAAFDIFSDFEMNATCYQVRDMNYPSRIDSR